MEENKYLFDDRELEDEEYIEEKDFKPIIDEKTQRDIEKQIDDILDEISTQI